MPSEEELLQRLYEYVANIEDIDPDSMKDTMKSLVENALQAGIPASRILEDALAQALDKIGARYEAKEYFISDLIFGAHLMGAAMEILEPQLVGAQAKSKGVVVLGTVRGDLHDIGKDIVGAMLKGAGFQVFDIGIDQPTEAFVDKTKETQADIVAISALLTSTTPEVPKVIEALRVAGLRDKVKIIVGGRPVTKEFAQEVGADAYGENGPEAVALALELIGSEVN